MTMFDFILDITANFVATILVGAIFLYIFVWLWNSSRDASKNDESKNDISPQDETIKGAQESFMGSSRRRHSVSGGPFQFARVAAKHIIGNRSQQYRRQISEIAREVLPKPPTEYFEPSELPEIPQNLRPEYFYLRHIIQILELPNEWPAEGFDIDVSTYPLDATVFGPGDPDDSILVVLEGALLMYIVQNGKEYLVRTIEKGQTFFSYLSLLDILLKQPSTFKNLTVRAGMENTRVARYQVTHYYDDCQANPEQWMRPIQIIATRLLHVTMTTMHQYLGLGEELLQKRLDPASADKERRISVRSVRLGGGKRWPRKRRLSSSDYASEQISVATKAFGEALGLSHGEGHNAIAPRLKLVTVEENEVVVEKGSNDDPALMLVVSGSLTLTRPNDAEEEDDFCYPWSAFVHPGGFVGALQLLTAEPSFFRVAGALPSTTIAILKKSDIDEISKDRPAVQLALARLVLLRLTPFIRIVDFAIDWVFVDSGQAVYRQGDQAKALFVVLSGRMRSVDKKNAVAEFGQGDVLGMIEVIQKQPRKTTVLAVRFSHLAQVPDGLLNFIKMQYPQSGFRLVKLLGQSYNDTRGTFDLLHQPPYNLDTMPNDSLGQLKNLHTVAIVPASSEVPITSFTCELLHALEANTKVLRLSAKHVSRQLGESCLEKLADYRLMHWLSAQEDNYPLVVYECDYTATNWTRRCLRQADAILVVGRGDRKPQTHRFFEEHLKMNQDGIRTRKELILLWPEPEKGQKAKLPSGTIEWLKGSWFSGHYHVRAPRRMFGHLTADGEIDEETILDHYEAAVQSQGIADVHSDFSRLGRVLTGNAVGLVLGGGGARGASHIGVIQALRQSGVPVDIVGGTSIGSMISALYAEHPHFDLLTTRAASWFSTVSSIWRQIFDLTYAHSAIFTGRGFNATLQELFDTKTIEDLWLPYFCITTDITASEMRIHRTGPVWMYSRASMSLAGYLPPLCDPTDAHLLLDGGYVNNLPADVMKSLGAKFVIASDVGSATENNLTDYGDHLSGFWVLWRKYKFWDQPIKVLSMQEIQSRLAYVSCVRQLELVKKAPYVYYMRPPIEPFMTLDFHKFDAIREIGYTYGIHAVDEMMEKHPSLRAIMQPNVPKKTPSRRDRSPGVTRSTSFTDLAAQVFRIPTTFAHSKSVDVYDIHEWDDEGDEEGDSDDEDDLEDDPDRSKTPRPPSSSSTQLTTDSPQKSNGAGDDYKSDSEHSP